MRTPLRERVEAGAALLDKKRSTRMKPWRDKINTERLDISSPCECVLGQVYGGSYGVGLDKLGFFDLGGGSCRDLARECGFVTTAEDSRPLTRAWRKYLEAQP